jgi:fidgetin-like protein 1
MPKQLYIPLPCEEARRQMVLRQVGPDGGVASALSEADIDKIVSKTAGYSGSDMKNLVQEACQGPVRQAVVAHGAAGTLSLFSCMCVPRMFDSPRVN